MFAIYPSITIESLASETMFRKISGVYNSIT